MAYCWYWLDEFGEWIEYGEEHPLHGCATVTSPFLEKEFLADRRGLVLFRAGSQKYELDFEEMIQRNLVYKTERKVGRRRKLQLSQDEQSRSQSTTLSNYVYPPEWDLSALPGSRLVWSENNLDVEVCPLNEIHMGLHSFSSAVQLSENSNEYGKIKHLFEKTMKNYYIHQLHRIQNPALWQGFQWQKKQMKKLNKTRLVDERLLFHGTDPSHIASICEENFDWRICGTHGTNYGKGSYFARDASYAHQYCSSPSGVYSMFVANDVVGDFVQGNSTYVRPPPRPRNSSRIYDSCVNDLTDPSIFVIFEKHQIYPAYILCYTTSDQCVIL